jgi:hypothetical protein
MVVPFQSFGNAAREGGIRSELRLDEAILGVVALGCLGFGHVFTVTAVWDG